MMAAAFAIPGDLDLPTGGYAYDRAVLSRFPMDGLSLTHLALPAGFPAPTDAQVGEALAAVAATAPQTLLLIDGLALGTLPAEGLAALNRRIVALIHHPLALEAGLSAEERARLAASERAALAQCVHVIATSPATGRTLCNEFGIDPARLTIALPGSAATARAPADGNPPRLLAVGSLIPRKGYDVLLEALGRLKGVSWSLTIIGSLDLHPATVAQVRALIAAHGLDARITLAGAQPPEKLAQAFAASDLFVHPSLFEGYGMVLAEAMRHGLPIVCTTGGAANETVPDRAALKVPPGDVEALAGALRICLLSPKERRRLADAAFAAGQMLPDWDQTAQLIAGALKSAAAPETLS
ncbi:glycosyltransferase family 4 protein [Roseixanthobacter glucoisosaccharinicivorans]|uniref:glycosyltransferase family 4 protein n=1 Tax=Roseixanthobacter glucoisosaccharinicivorans TaxID=3119923 RepID=UPI003729102D